MYRVYIAGKLTDLPAGYIKNMHQMIKCANQIRKENFAPFVPCFDILLGLVAGDIGLGEYYKIGLAWLSVSDALLVLPDSEDSKGTQAEIKKAIELNIPVFYTIGELRAWRDEKHGF